MTKPKVKVSYQKAGKTPSKRKKTPSFMRTPAGISPLTKYIEENRDTGIPVPELIWQFQEYDCDHPKSDEQVMAAGTTYKFVRCARCHRVEKRTHG